MRVLVVGKGGREHALVWKLAQSPRVSRVYCAPGNAGTALEGQNVDVEPTDFDRLIRFAKKENIGLTVVGPEEPLTLGIVDHFEKNGLRIFGPPKAAAELEGSKVFAKELMRQADIPTAEFRIFDHPDPARRYVETRDYPLVVKADGLAAGKGAIVCGTTEEALAAVELIMVREAFGRAGRRVVIEKRLEGQELSVMAFVSGRTLITLATTQDHKAAFDNDQGPNTGGMGAYCPATLATLDLLSEVESTILVPTVHAMKRCRRAFRGVLYAGIMLTNQGPRVLEFNVRLGDPETQPLLMRLQNDLLDVLEAAVDGRLDHVLEQGLTWDPRPAVCVVMASGGYPGSFQKGRSIDGLDAAALIGDAKVFHAGTKKIEHRTVTTGGRVLGVTALGDDLAKAKAKAYEVVAKIGYAGAFYRKDIGNKALVART